MGRLRSADPASAVVGSVVMAVSSLATTTAYIRRRAWNNPQKAGKDYPVGLDAETPLPLAGRASGGRKLLICGHPHPALPAGGRGKKTTRYSAAFSRWGQGKQIHFHPRRFTSRSAITVSMVTDGRLRQHARTQQAGEAVIVEHDLHKGTRHDRGEIAGGVVRRQPVLVQGRWPATRLSTWPVSLGKWKLSISIFDRLTVAHMGELGLFEIGHDIDCIKGQRHRHQLRTGLHELADPQGPRTHGAVDRRGDLGVGDSASSAARPRGRESSWATALAPRWMSTSIFFGGDQGPGFGHAATARNLRAATRIGLLRVLAPCRRRSSSNRRSGPVPAAPGAGSLRRLRHRRCRCSMTGC